MMLLYNSNVVALSVVSTVVVAFVVCGVNLAAAVVVAVNLTSDLSTIGVLCVLVVTSI